MKPRKFKKFNPKAKAGVKTGLLRRKKHSKKATALAKEPAFVPEEGQYASFYYAEDKIWYDVMVKKIQGEFAAVHYKMDENLQKQKDLFKVRLNLLHEPLSPNVAQRFTMYERMCNLALYKRFPCLLVTGEGGIGKGYTLNQILEREELEEKTDYIRIKGHSSPLALYQLLYDYNDKVVILDDCDEAFKNSIATNIMKSVLDSYKVRQVNWMSSRNSGRYPNSFNFTGTVIFVSNLAKSRIDQAILSRAISVDLHMTPDEKMDRMRMIVDYMEVGSSMTPDKRQEVLTLIDRYKYTVHDLSIRTLVKALSTYEHSEDLELVRYQVLNG